MSRERSSFFRSNRHSGSHSSPAQHHQRGASHGATPDTTSQRESSDAATSAAVPSRSRSNNTPPATHSAQVMLRGMERLEKRRTMEERNFLQTKARSQNLNPPVDFRLLDYVSPYDENLTCPICRCPFVDPVILNECDHCFCRDCIRQTWTASTAYNPLGPRGDCPTCRTPAKLGPRSATSKILTNILDDLLVKCPKTEEGCKAKVKRGEVQDHMSIYCGYALIECPLESCELPVRRKDSPQGCLHFAVSCLACREEMQKCHLETHWRSKCPDREITCESCKKILFYRDLAKHNQRDCPSTSIRCPGHALGCPVRGKKDKADDHARTCIFAKLAPVLSSQHQRMDEQEAAQKEMSRKLEILESGFANMHGMMFPGVDEPEQSSVDARSIPVLRRHADVSAVLEADLATADGNGEEPAAQQARLDNDSGLRRGRAPSAPGPRPVEIPEPFSPDFDLASPFPPPATNGPYASPLHHLLSMHESLRDEMSRVNAALQELDGRHSMQTLNENMRTREEITYLGAQVAGLSRQVHWLTSAQLQRQSRSGTPGSAEGSAAAAGPSMEAAINSAVRGAERIINAGREGVQMRRRPSEEGRTKL